MKVLQRLIEEIENPLTKGKICLQIDWEEAKLSYVAIDYMNFS